MFSKRLLPWLGLYWIGLAVYSVFSYSLTAPNLILTNWSGYWQFQTWMWSTFFNDRPLLAMTYTLIIGLMSVAYLMILKTVRSIKGAHSFFSSKSWWWLALVVLPLLLANNALSYDVFNYIFNAKMVTYYQANPHQQVALDFAYDDWTRFMHNTHTPAPYGYGWTILSLLPYTLSLGKFLPAWLLFRGMSVISLAGLWLLLAKYLTVEQKRSWLVPAVLFNPLLLIEIVSNSHNDLWMMVPAIWSLLLISRPLKSRVGLTICGSLLLLGSSVFIKLATLALLPLWIALLLVQIKIIRDSGWLKDLREGLVIFWPVLASILMFLPLLTARSQQFLPWYLVWSLVWLPFWPSRQPSNQGWKNLCYRFASAWLITLIAFSVTGLARYWPYLRAGEYTPLVLTQQLWILWMMPIGLLIISLLTKQTGRTGK